MGPLGVLVDSQVCGSPLATVESNQVHAVDVHEVKGPSPGRVRRFWRSRMSRMGSLGVFGSGVLCSV